MITRKTVPTSPITALLQKLGFSPDNVVQAASENPLNFRDAIEFRQHCLGERTRAKMMLERTQAERALAINKDFRDRGEKITEAIRDALVLLDPEVRTASDAFARADESDEYSKLVVEAFRMQRDCLKIVADLTWNEMSIQRAVSTNAEKMEATQAKLAKYPGGV